VTVRIDIPARDIAADLELADALTVEPTLAQVLRARGVTDAEDAASFLFPDLATVTPAADIPEVERAAELLHAACRRHRRVFIAGDYDVDGLAATALLTTVLRNLGAEVLQYIPNRLTEGYDLSAATVRRAVAAGAHILVTADCGNRAHDALAAAVREGLTVIVTDHHRLAETLPPADVVVTSQRLPEGHHARTLAGVGVAFKLAECLLAAGDADVRAASLLPHVALGTVCDVVPLTGDNRILAAAGLREFPGPLLPGVKALMAEARVDGETVTAWHLAYILGPRLNAAGRLGHAEFALQLLLAEDETQGRPLARRLELFNRERRAREKDIAGAAFKEAEAQVAAGRRGIVAAHEGWHAGVIGIVAARIAEKLFRPTVLISLDGERGRGSCRSIPAFDIHEALTTLRDYMIRFGGHRQAAGFEIERAAVAPFADAFGAYAAANLDEDNLQPVITVDGTLPLNAVTAGAITGLSLLEPLGEANPPPTFFARVTVSRETQKVIKGAHLSFEAAAGPAKFRAFGYNFAPDGEPLPAGQYGLAFSPTIDSWRGRKRAELRLHYIIPLAAAGDARNVTVIDRRNAPWEEAVADADASNDAVFGLPRQRVLAGPMPFVEYTAAPPNDTHWRRLFLAAPPFDAHRLMALALAADTLIFAFGESAGRDARELLERLYPSRKRLEASYRRLRAGETPEDGVGETRARAVFAELGLIETVGTKAILPKEAGPRRALSDSALFRRCERLRGAAEEFIDNLSRWPAAMLREAVTDLARAGKGLDTPSSLA